MPAALVFFNWGEYRIHKSLGYHKHPLGRMFYKRHTGDHHSFFVAGQMRYEQARDWRVILFPAWLVVVFSLGALLAWSLLGLLNDNLAALFAATLLLGYLSYEIFHACEHLPPEHPLSRLPWIRHMRRLHELHHRRELMQTHNFNLVFPLMDWCYGTLHWEAETAEEHAMTRMQHRIEIARGPGGDPRLRRQPGALAGMASLVVAGRRRRWPAAGRRALRGGHPRRRPRRALVLDGGRVPAGTPVARQRPWRPGLHLRLSYECQPSAAGTRFVRTLEYRFDGWSMRLANLFLLRRRIERESEESMHRLRRVAEARIAAAESEMIGVRGADRRRTPMNKFAEMTTFVSVVDAHSFSEAARRLGTTKSQVSQRIQQLERRSGPGAAEPHPAAEPHRPRSHLLRTCLPPATGAGAGGSLGARRR